VIRSDVAVLDLDAAQWAALHELVLESRRRRRWGYVLHAGGHVLTCHPPGIGVAPDDRVEEPEALAQRLQDQGGFDRVVVLDRDQLQPLARAAAELVERDGDLTTYRERVDALYWSSSAVVTAPAAPANPWRELRLLAEALGSALVHVDVYDDTGATRTTAVALLVSGGSVTRVSSPAGGDVPDVVLALGAADLIDALRSEHLVGHLLEAAGRDTRSSGLARLEGLRTPAPARKA
jgi:hypothetical protein